MTGYLQNSGVPVADVPPSLRFDPQQNVALRTEAYRLAANGDVLKPAARGDTAADGGGVGVGQAWPTQGSRGQRLAVPVTLYADRGDPTDATSRHAVNGLDLQSDQSPPGKANPPPVITAPDTAPRAAPGSIPNTQQVLLHQEVFTVAMGAGGFPTIYKGTDTTPPPLATLTVPGPLKNALRLLTTDVLKGAGEPATVKQLVAPGVLANDLTTCPVIKPPSVRQPSMAC